jgi:ferredoxin-NADP reductase
VARAAVLGGLSWRVATARRFVDETASARTIAFDIPGWPGHLAGQHVDVRLTAPDGYTATRAYSIANAPDGELVEITVARVPDGEVSPYLTTDMRADDQVEVRGPLGGWFVWRPEQTEPVQLLAGGVGLVPLMAMIRTRAAVRSSTPMHLLCSVREPAAALYRAELAAERARIDGAAVTWQYTRTAPSSGGHVGRLDLEVLQRATLPASVRPTSYVCGPTGFVETASALLVESGHAPASIRAERFGPTGG